MFVTKVTTYPCRVEFEDVDYVGVVHHPIYLLYCERARSRGMEEGGLSFLEFIKKGFCFAVAEASLRYMKPLRVYDPFYVHSIILTTRKSSVMIRQVISSEPELSLEKIQENKDISGSFFTMDMRLVCLENGSFLPTPLPDFFLERFCLSSEKGI